MRQRAHDIYASAPMRGLLADETVAYMPDVRRCAGTRALLLSAAAYDEPPSSPYLGQWITMRLREGRYWGDLRASVEDSLPFLDHVFDLVLLRHALEPASLPLHEFVRVLAPGGVMILTGVNPLSSWTPWWLWHTRGSGTRATSPIRVAALLRRVDLQVERVQHVGPFLPLSGEVSRRPSGWLGGGYVLIARKKGSLIAPTRLRPKPVAAPVHGGLAPGARRSSVS